MSAECLCFSRIPACRRAEENEEINVGRVLVHNDSPAFRRSCRRRRFC